MRNQTKQLLAVAAILAMSGCESISGTLTVNPGQTLQLKDKNGQNVTLNAGNATVVMSSGKIQLKAQNSNGKKDTVEVDALKNALPAYQTSGNHLFAAKDTGQPVDINEVTLNDTTVGREHVGWESCTQVVTVEVPCPPPVVVQPPQNGDGNGNGNGGDHNQNPPKNNPQPEPTKKGGREARNGKSSNRHLADVCTDNRVVEGRQQVQFHFEGDNFEIQLIMSDPSSGTQIASFDGYSYQGDRVVDQYLTPCLIH